MKKTISAVALTLLLATPVVYAADPPAPAAHPYSYKTPKLDRAAVDKLLAHPEKLVVIDLRRPDELTKIGGFPVYLSIQAKQLEQNLAYIPKDRQIVTVSNHAGRAGAAADFLSEHGFKVVGAIGSQNYEEEGGTITKIAPPVSNP